MIELPVERGKDMFSDGFASMYRRMQARYYPYADELMELFAASSQAKELVPGALGACGSGAEPLRCGNRMRLNAKYPLEANVTSPRLFSLLRRRVSFSRPLGVSPR